MSVFYRNHTRNKGGRTNLKVEVQINNLHTTVQIFFCIFVNFCTLVLLNSQIFPDPLSFPRLSLTVGTIIKQAQRVMH